MTVSDLFYRGARVLAPIALLISLGGCATFSEDGGFGAVEAEVRDKLGAEAKWHRDDDQRETAQAEVATLLGAELTVESAMQVALLNNPGLQASYANLGLQEAEMVRAGRLPNPGFTFGKTSAGNEQEIERGLHFNLLALLTLPVRFGIEEERFEAAKLAAIAETIDTAMSARNAFYEAVAARQAVEYAEQVVEAADASRQLMARMSAVGNSSRLEHAREQLFYAEATAALAAANQRAGGAREALIRSLGLWGTQTTDLRLPTRLPELPDAPQDLKGIEQTAIAQRMDVRQAKRSLDALTANLELSETIGFLNVLEIGPAQVRETGEEIKDGYEIAFEIPIFDFGQVKTAQAEALYNQAVEQLRAAAVNARSEVRSAYSSYRTAYDLTRHYRDEVVPLRKRISDEQLLRYNGMLTGVFELIADAREQVMSINTYFDTLRQFWLADTALQTAMLIGNAPSVSLNAAMASGGDNGAGH